MNEEGIFKQIFKIAGLLLLAGSLIVGSITQDLMLGISIVYGGFISMLGFALIIISSKRLLESENVSRIAFTQYMFRYLLYGILVVIGIQMRLNIVGMLVGLVVINLAIKIHTLIS